MKLDSILFWLKNFTGNLVFSVCEVVKDIRTIIHDKKRKSPPITTTIVNVDNDNVFRGFEIEIEEEWLERGITKYGKWKC